MRAVIFSLSPFLPAMSKRVSQLGETADQLVGTAAQVGVHDRILHSVQVARLAAGVVSSL
jgi:hypothetical protein